MTNKNIREEVWRNAFINLDDEGNISDHSKKIKSDSSVNRSRAIKLLISTPEWLEQTQLRNKEKANNPSYIKKLSESQKKLNSDEEYKSRRLAANAKGFTEEVTARMSAIQKEICNRPEIKKARSEARKKPIHTPLGDFPSLGEAGIYYTENGTVNARKKILRWLYTRPNDFYYIVAK